MQNLCSGAWARRSAGPRPGNGKSHLGLGLAALLISISLSCSLAPFPVRSSITQRCSPRGRVRDLNAGEGRVGRDVFDTGPLCLLDKSEVDVVSYVGLLTASRGCLRGGCERLCRPALSRSRWAWREGLKIVPLHR